MKKALVMGGTRFFGVHLVHGLLENGFEVTVATRGRTKDPFGNAVHRLNVDRSSKESLLHATENKKWDIVYDQICFSSEEALDAIEVFEGKTNRYVLTSSLSVYDIEAADSPFSEEKFNPYQEKLVISGSEEVSYQQGKQQAEAVLFQKASFPAVAARLPIVLGENDYTDRLNFYIDRIKKNKPVHLLNPEAEMNFISEQEAGRFLAWLATSELEGPVNACADGTVTMGGLMELIADTAGQKVNYTSIELESPYNVPETWTMSNEKARRHGFKFSNLEDWLPELVRTLEREV